MSAPAGTPLISIVPSLNPSPSRSTSSRSTACTWLKTTPPALSAGVRPYGFDIASKGEVAVVANIGVGSGDADTIRKPLARAILAYDANSSGVT